MPFARARLIRALGASALNQKEDGMKGSNSTYSLPLIFLCLLCFPGLAAAQCEGQACDACTTMADFVSSLPHLPANDLRRGKFSVVTERDRDTLVTGFLVSYAVNGKAILQKRVPQLPYLEGELHVTPTRAGGFNGLDFWFLYGAGGRVRCEYIVSPHLESNGGSSWHYKYVSEKSPSRSKHRGTH